MRHPVPNPLKRINQSEWKLVSAFQAVGNSGDRRWPQLNEFVYMLTVIGLRRFQDAHYLLIQRGLILLQCQIGAKDNNPQNSYYNC